MQLVDPTDWFGGSSQQALCDDLTSLPDVDASPAWVLTRGRIHRPRVKRFLARLIHELGQESGQSGRCVEYITASGRQAYEAEHIWAEQSWAEDREGFRTRYPQEENFREARNRIGALLPACWWKRTSWRVQQ